MAKCFFALCLLGAIFSPTLHAQTINAAGCDPSSVQAALNSANEATATVIIPAGKCPWTSAISYTVPSSVTSLTIQGQTSVSCTGTPGTSGYVCTPTDATVIEDAYAAYSSILDITLSSSTTFRMTGLTIQADSSDAKSQGIIDFLGSTTSFRVDHVDLILNSSDNNGFEVDGQIEGVFDHDVLNIGAPSAATYTNGIRVFNHLFDTVGNADGTFMTATDWGTSHFIFLENSYIIGGYTNDCATGGRMVERYNFFLGPTATMQSHGTKDYAGAERGCRAQEFYHNYVSGGYPYAVIGGSGGTWLIWGNTAASGNWSWLWAGDSCRSAAGCTPGYVAPPNGWGTCGTDMNNSDSPWDGNSSTVTGYPCLDNLGRGQQAQAMNGANFSSRINVVTGTQSWPQQYLEPIYMWMNTVPSGIGIILDQDDTTTANRDIYGDCGYTNSPGCSGGFTGAAGTGYGLLSARPATCTAGAGGTYATSPTGSYGVAYWATDANSGSGELYVCTATNTWTPVYEPYAYPHPLDGGTAPSTGNSPSSEAPQPPTGLSATVQ